jgi:tetratricopeptide (TPR) repeat protein
MMSKKVLLAETLLALFVVLGFKLSTTDTEDKLPYVNRQKIYTSRLVMGCSPDWNLLDADSLASVMKPLPGWGNYTWNIATASDSARFYFNQGINMYYAFHIIESMGSFKKAATFETNNPMIYWAQALAYGPNINDFAYAAAPDALAAIQKAVSISASGTPKEKALINAMAQRYSKDTTISRKDLNQRYAAAMKKVYAQFRNDADAGALYADALMLQHPWEYWLHNGKAQPWTPEIVSVLEEVLAKHPSHPGANHYYIHTVEASPNPGRALPSADRLGKMMPDVSHMVHMPSHIYIRTGNYEKGMAVNDLAINGYAKYKSLYPDVINNAFLYIIHNYHMKAACAMMKPNYKASLKAANECVASFDSAYLSLPHPLGNAVQYIYLTPQMVNVRYGKWNEILAQPEISSNYAFGFLLSKWARGMALANMGNMEQARSELALLKEKMGHPDLQIRLEPFNIPYDQSVVAEKILEGTIAQKGNDLAKAIDIFAAAVIAEDKLIYTEPRDWLIPTRHYLADALLKSKEYNKAKKVLLEDLKINPHNFYALSALELVAAKENNILQQMQYKKELNAAYTHSDMRYAALVYQ